MRIAVDATGGEHAPREIVKGAIKAAREYKIGITLLGKKSVLHVLAGKHLTKLDINIISAEETIGYHESPIEAVRTKPNSSIVTGIGLVK